MEKIADNYHRFAECVANKRFVVVNEKGEWYIPNRFARFVRRIFQKESTRLQNIVRIFSKEMDKHNQVKISNHTDDSGQNALQKFKSCIAAAETLGKVGSYREIESKKVSMQYRLGGANGGLEKEDDVGDVLYHKFEAKAKEWKKREFFFKSDEKELTPDDIKNLKEFCRYKKYAELAEKNPGILVQLFKWSIRDKNSVDIFVQFTFIQEKISQSALSRRVGLAGEKVFGMKVDELTGEKDVTLAFVKDEGNIVEHVSLLDETREVQFNPQFKVSIKNVYRIFSDKRKDIVGNIEMFEKGIHNWNVAKIGKSVGKTHDVVDTTKSGWWKELPTYKTLSIAEARGIYGDHMDGVNWTVSAKSAVEKCLFDFEGNHGFMEVIIPVNGEYRVYPFGKFVDDFPTNTLAKLIFIFRTVKARVHYLDQNVYYGQRQTWGHHVPLNPAQGEALMGHIAADIRHDTGSNSKFSFKKFNCSQWVQSTIKKTYGKDLPNLYKIPFTNIKPQNFLKHFFNLILRTMNGNTHHPYKLVEQIKHKTISPIALKVIP